MNELPQNFYVASGSKNDEKVKVLRMEFSIVENLSGLQESIFNLSRAPNSILAKKLKIDRILLNLSIFPLSPCLGSLGLLSFNSGHFNGDTGDGNSCPLQIEMTSNNKDQE